jgi:2-dehydropantoate 2-reductase
MRFSIIGAGAVGGYFGAKLQLAGEEVTFAVRERRYCELEKNSLRLSSKDGTVELKVHAIRKVDEIEECDVVIVAVKNYSLDQVLESVSYLADNGARVLTLMNGVEQFQKIRSKVQDSKIIGGVCHMESTLEHGTIVQTGITPRIILGSPSHEGMNFASEVASAFRKAKVETMLSERIITEIWKKFIFITALSTSTCIARAPIGPIIANPYSRKALEQVLDEIVSVAKALEPSLPGTVREEIMNQLQNLPVSMTASMERDLQQGRPLEVENLQGYLVRGAEELGMTVPALAACYGLLKLRETGNIDRS